MSTPEKPLILHVDDRPEELRTWKDMLESSNQVLSKLCRPHDVTENDLSEASVVLVDVKLDDWPERDALDALGLQPINGLALLTILQEHAHKLSKQRPCAFALYTGAVRDVSRGLVPQGHIVARAHNLDWVFNKSHEQSRQLAKVVELANAVRALPPKWPSRSPEEAKQAIRTWLALPEENDVDWADSAWKSVERCHPPAHELAEHTHGMAFLRWFLHRILPYPCFLLDDAHLASRLRVTLPSLRHALQESTRLRQYFEGARYSGQMAQFMGERWWRAGVEMLLFSLAHEDPANLELVHERLLEIEPSLKPQGIGMFVPAIGENYEYLRELIPVEEAVRVQPDDWPPYGDQAWTSSELAKDDPMLSAIASRGA